MLVKSITKSLLVVAVIAATTQMASAATIGYWRFEEGTPPGSVGTGVGEVLDSSGNTNHGTRSATGLSVDYSSDVPGSTILPGDLSNSVSISQASGSSGSRIVVPGGSATLGNLSGGFTVEAFVKSTGSGDNDRKGIVTKWIGGGAVFQFRETATDTLQFFLNKSGGAGNENIATTTVIPENAWSHVAAVYDPSDAGAEMKLYINGVLGASGAFADTLNAGADDLWIGDGAGSGDRFAGGIDEVRISNVALTPAQFLTAVPEPSTIALLCISALGMLFAVKRKK